MVLASISSSDRVQGSGSLGLRYKSTTALAFIAKYTLSLLVPNVSSILIRDKSSGCNSSDKPFTLVLGATAFAVNIIEVPPLQLALSVKSLNSTSDWLTGSLKTRSKLLL